MPNSTHDGFPARPCFPAGTSASAHTAGTSSAVGRLCQLCTGLTWALTRLLVQGKRAADHCFMMCSTGQAPARPKHHPQPSKALGAPGRAVLRANAGKAQWCVSPSGINLPNSFKYFPFFFFSSNLMFPIIHLSQKIINRGRNENLSHIL